MSGVLKEGTYQLTGSMLDVGERICPEPIAKEITPRSFKVLTR
jgi:hypothetical protein